MTIIDKMNSEMMEVEDYLLQNGQLSMLGNIERNLAKVYVLSMASYFEKEIQDILIEYVNKKTGNCIEIENFVKKKAISLQYHTYFSWGEKDRIDKPGKNANVFFALFGDDFKSKIESEISKDAKLDDSVKAFLEIGHIRNILVHSNFAAFNYDAKTTKELISTFERASLFLDYLRSKFSVSPL